MKNMNQNQPPVPPRIPPVTSPGRTAQPATADDPTEREPIHGVMAAIEIILRQPRRVIYALRQPGAWRVVVSMIFSTLVCVLVYGLVVGTFSRGEQFWIAPVKIATGLGIAALICLPSLYIFACLGGSQARLSEMAGLVAGFLLLMALLLIGFAPVAWLFSESTNSLCWMGTLHLLFWAIATAFGLRFLGAGFAATQARSRSGLMAWSVIFILVALQMTTALRPIVGTADTFLPDGKKFFLQHWVDCIAAPVPACPET